MEPVPRTAKIHLDTKNTVNVNSLTAFRVQPSKSRINTCFLSISRFIYLHPDLTKISLKHTLKALAMSCLVTDIPIKNPYFMRVCGFFTLSFAHHLPTRNFCPHFCPQTLLLTGFAGIFSLKSSIPSGVLYFKYSRQTH